MTTVIIAPVICPAGKEVRFTLRNLTPGASYRISILPVFDPDTRLNVEAAADADGCLAWKQEVAWQGEALVDVFPPGAQFPAATLRLFAVSPGLAGRLPLRGDFHLHTTHSDGKDSVAEMIVCCREVGLDALAITDHNVHASSLEGIEVARRLGLGLTCLPGEEVTSATWHLVALGASQGIGYTPEHGGYAGLRWAIDRIHQLGGKAYLAHPYWISNRHLNQPAEEYERVLAEGGLDGVELLGEVPWEENLRSVARYYELPYRLPVLGNSDSHSSGARRPGRPHTEIPLAGQTSGKYWTLILARSRAPQDVLEAIEAGYSAACARMLIAPETFPVRPRLLAFGPFELVNLAIFLEEVYFPRHDELCRLEADAARRILAGEALPEAVIHGLEVELNAHHASFWGA